MPSELERLQTGGALPSMPSLDEHTKELQKHLELATQLLTAAREKQLAVSREKFNQNQVETIFIPGEHVRLWKRVPIRRKEGSVEIASKLKLFNKEYQVVTGQLGAEDHTKTKVFGHRRNEPGLDRSQVPCWLSVSNPWPEWQSQFASPQGADQARTRL